MNLFSSDSKKKQGKFQNKPLFKKIREKSDKFLNFMIGY